jgi:hypothetical protein
MKMQLLTNHTILMILNLFRNTLPYKISDNYAGNDFIIESGDRSNQQSIVESVSEGSISGFNIINSGTNYKIDDVLNFDDANTSGGGLLQEYHQ